MNISIQISPRPVEEGGFRYGNRDSRYGVNTVYFTRDGKPFVPIAGELHFSRLPHESWRRELLKMRDCGINVVSTYVFWNYHEEEKGAFEFSGDQDIAAFLEICRSIQMPCLLRIGPWCHGEVIRGGFPRRIARMPGKRKNNPAYLQEVEDFWRALHGQVAPFLDGETVIGIQLENEYTGSTEHIRTLRRLAEKIGFQVPFFTMTAWPSNCPDPEFLPMAGGYPDAPWSRGKKALAPNNRFSITSGRTEAEIGADLIKNKTEAEAGVYSTVPFASCETGPGNQVTQHRRPLISEKDGYGVCFAKFASGMNWLGYYMFHGGRNPNGRLMQENRLTGYPNNYAIIDYDFQAPLSRYGECRPHGDRLRLMHLFINSFDPEVCVRQAFFPQWQSNDPKDISFLKCSVRADESLSGYFFASAYEKSLSYRDFKDVRVTLASGGKKLVLPSIDVKAGAMFFYPFNLALGGFRFDYILAQPVARVESGGRLDCYFVQCEGIHPRFSIDGNEAELPIGEDGRAFTAGGKTIRLIVLSQEQAKQFHLADGKPLFAKGTVYTDGGAVFCETTDGFLQNQTARSIDLRDAVSLKPCGKKRLPFNYFLYSHGKRTYYALTIRPEALRSHFDVRLVFAFDGLNLQVFSGQTLINDFFNIDGRFEMCLREYRRYLERDGQLIIRAVPKTKWGVGNVYQEAALPCGTTGLRLLEACAVSVLETKL